MGFVELIQMILRFVLYRICKLSVSEARMSTMVQFIQFGIIGISNTILSYVIYVLVILVFRSLQLFPIIDYLIAQFIGFVLSVLWSFYWNQKFVFKIEEKRNLVWALIKTYISYAFTGLFLNSILSIIWVELLHWSKMIAPIVNLCVSVPLNFAMNKFWAFKSK